KRGSPSVSSSTCEGRASNSIPSCSRIALLCGDADASTSRGTGLILSPKEQLCLALGRLVRVRAVDHVLADLERVVTTDRAGVRLERVGRPDHLAGGHHGLVAFEHHRDERAAGDEVDELAEERLALVL